MFCKADSVSSFNSSAMLFVFASASRARKTMASSGAPDTMNKTSKTVASTQRCVRLVTCLRGNGVTWAGLARRCSTQA